MYTEFLQRVSGNRWPPKKLYVEFNPKKISYFIVVLYCVTVKLYLNNQCFFILQEILYFKDRQQGKLITPPEISYLCVHYILMYRVYFLNKIIYINKCELFINVMSF